MKVLIISLLLYSSPQDTVTFKYPHKNGFFYAFFPTVETGFGYRRNFNSWGISLSTYFKPYTEQRKTRPAFKYPYYVTDSTIHYRGEGHGQEDSDWRIGFERALRIKKFDCGKPVIYVFFGLDFMVGKHKYSDYYSEGYYKYKSDSVKQEITLLNETNQPVEPGEFPHFYFTEEASSIIEYRKIGILPSISLQFHGRKFPGFWGFKIMHQFNVMDLKSAEVNDSKQFLGKRESQFKFNEGSAVIILGMYFFKNS